MQPHVKIYLKYFGYSVADNVYCEHCGIISNDIHHLKPRSLCSKEEVNKIGNLIALCRFHHERAHKDREFNEELKRIHLKKVNAVEAPITKLVKD